MTDTSSFDLPLLQIVIPNDRARALDPVWAEALAGMIRAQGLINPITVRKINDGAYGLVSGLHRHAAFGILGSDEIPCRLSTAQSDDEARLEEVMENLGRNELNALDRCHHLYELKQVYERVYPETKNGGYHGNQHTGGRTEKVRSGTDDEPAQIFGFVKATADQIGMSESSIQKAVKIWVGLTPDSRARLEGTCFAEKQSEIRLLSVQKKVVQGRILDLVLAVDTSHHSVQGALDHLSNAHVPSNLERKYQALKMGLSNLEDPDFDRIILDNEERIIATLKRQGRI